jgi:uncharacterized membrane protein YkoI
MQRVRKTWIGAPALALCALVGATVAFGASGSATKTSTTGTSTTGKTAHTPEAALTGDVLAKVKAAAVAKVGGTVDSATAENDSSNTSAVYEAHVTKADGTHVTVILDSAYAVLSVETGGPGGHGGGGNGESALTGDVATKANAAAIAAAGGTADRATTETDSSNAAAAYEVHVTKVDGSHVVVILDKNDAVLSIETQANHPSGHDGGGRH